MVAYPGIPAPGYLLDAALDAAGDALAPAEHAALTVLARAGAAERPLYWDDYHPQVQAATGDASRVLFHLTGKGWLRGCHPLILTIPAHHLAAAAAAARAA